ncbi:hypothetical protein BH10CYA1_BH10CYA1_34590 [soil metagenome]
MNNSDSIREFFRRLADGAGAQSPRFEILHNSSSLLPRSSQNDNLEYVFSYASQHDFGIGLPPLANS